jgi:N-acetylglucosamine kinase-like BadF-type ATPase
MRVVGVDGGGTRTRAVMVDCSGQVCGQATGGGGNFQLVGREGLEALLGALLEELGVERSEPISLCLALAGAGRSDEQKEIASLVRARGWATLVCAVSDARAALEGAHAGEPGIIVISGTGSIVLGKNDSGLEARAGGWGPVLGDEGSGYSIGLEALRAVFRARDGWGPDTRLCAVLREALRIESWDRAVRKVYGGEVGRKQIAALGPQVFAVARQGDEVALRIVAEAGTALGRQVGAVGARLEMTGRADLACVGGVFSEVEMLWPALEAAAAETVESLRRREPLLPPVLGAVLLAWQQAGWIVDGKWVAELARQAFRIP